MVNLGTNVYFPAEKITFSKQQIMSRSMENMNQDEKFLMTYVRMIFNLFAQSKN